jgi:hypothetical protein
MKPCIHAGSCSLGGGNGQRVHSVHPYIAEVNAMSKSQDSHKESKKKPLKSLHDKSLAKREKKHGTTLLGSHTATP